MAWFRGLAWSGLGVAGVQGCVAAIDLLNVVLIPVSFLFHVSRGERAILIAVCLLALIVELLNSAIEAAIDRISLERHPLSKNAKDMGSAAQFVALSMIAVVWGLILLG